MPRCAECNVQVADGATRCPTCGADLSRRAATVAALARFQDNVRVSMVRVSVADDCCPACAAMQGDLAPIQWTLIMGELSRCSNSAGLR
jgi:uncharacterized protein (UPF0212 family)